MTTAHDADGESAALRWKKSSFSGSGGDGGSCVEVARLPDGSTAVRHSRYPDRAVLVYSQDEWDAFLAGARGGEFD
jgi:uncharacterized protein DUF397